MRETKVYSGMMDATWKIYRTHGLAGLYSGISVTLIEIVPYSALQFAAYDFFHQTVDSYKVSFSSLPMDSQTDPDAGVSGKAETENGD